MNVREFKGKVYVAGAFIISCRLPIGNVLLCRRCCRLIDLYAFLGAHTPYKDNVDADLCFCCKKSYSVDCYLRTQRLSSLRPTTSILLPSSAHPRTNNKNLHTFTRFINQWCTINLKKPVFGVHHCNITVMLKINTYAILITLILTSNHNYFKSCGILTKIN